MHKHIFTLGLMLISIYTTTAMAWPTKTATDVWTNSTHTSLATMRCDNCCKTNCWLPSGKTYYDAKGTFTTSCSGEPAEPTCDPNRTYSVVSGACKAGACVSGTYDIGFDLCADPAVDGSDIAYIGDRRDMWARVENAEKYGLTADQTWALTFPYGIVKGEASCNDTAGTTMGESTTTNFSRTSTGQYCWCKMTEPKASLWVHFKFSGGSSGKCAADCAYYCVDRMYEQQFFRSYVYPVVGK